MASLWQRARAALGFTSNPSPRVMPGPTPEAEQQIRDQHGGQLSYQPRVIVQWHLADLVDAQRQAGGGNLSKLGQLLRYMRSDGLYSGLVATRSNGLTRLPKAFYGDPGLVHALRDQTEDESIFQLVCPPTELAAIVSDGDVGGVGIGELVDVPGRDWPVLVRLDPEFLHYNWDQGQWYYMSLAGQIPVNPGDGRWVLHLPYGKVAPWSQALWIACAQAVITKEHAKLRRAAYSAKHSMPVRVARSPIAAAEETRDKFVADLLAYRESGCVQLPTGFEVEYLEANGRGIDVYAAEVEASNFELMIALAGQTVSTEGGKGFSSTDLHRHIRADIIQASGHALSHTLNTQVLPLISLMWGGEEILRSGRGARISYDTRQPKDLASEASTLQTAASAITSMSEAAAREGRELDFTELCSRFDVPLLPKKEVEPLDIDIDTSDFDEPKSAEETVDVDKLGKLIDLAERVGLQPTKQSISALAVKLGVSTEDLPPTAQKTAKLDLAPTDLAKVVKVNEARQSQQLPPIEDEKGGKFISELGQPEADQSADLLIGDQDQ